MYEVLLVDHADWDDDTLYNELARDIGARNRSPDQYIEVGRRWATEKPLIQRRFNQRNKYHDIADVHSPGWSQHTRQWVSEQVEIGEQRRLMRDSAARYRDNFLKLELVSQSEEVVKNIQDTAEWLGGRPPELKDIIEFLAHVASDPRKRTEHYDSMYREKKPHIEYQSYEQHLEDRDLLTKKFVNLMKAIRDRVHATNGNSTLDIRSNRRRPIQPNASVVFHDGRDDGFNEYLSKPDIAMVKTNNDDASVRDPEDGYETWENVVLAAQVRLDKQDDMRAEAEYEMQWDIVPQMLDDQKFLLRHRPVTRTTYTFTLAGPCLRFWEFDPKAFASSRMYRLDDPEHARDIVDIVAFLTDPEAPFHDRWIPDRLGITIRPLDGQATQFWTWTDVVSPYKYLCIRQALFDSRTTVFAGKAKPEDSDDEPMDVVVKAWWTYREVEDYELKMLDRLHNGEAQYAFDLSSTDPVPMDIIDPKVIACLPRALGVVHVEQVDPEVWKTRTSGSPRSLCIMATSGPLGWNMPTEPDTDFPCNGRRVVLGLRHYGQILLGVCESLWYAAIRGVHHRDISLGNIMWTWVEDVPGDPSSGRAVGYLVDFGNARHLDTPRYTYTEERNLNDDLYALSMDDGRSATPGFSSIHNFDAQRAPENFEKARVKLDEAARNQSPLKRADEIQLANAKRDYKAALVQMRMAIHRCIDDLESVIYAFIIQMSWISGIDPKHDHKLEGLKDETVKRSIWNNPFLIFGLGCGTVWNDMKYELADIIRTARDALTEEFSRDPSQPVPAEMLPIENRCFADCVERIKSVLSKLPENAVVQ